MSRARLLGLGLAGALGVVVARPLGADPDTFGSSRRATRKEAAADRVDAVATADQPFALPTWATLVNVHTGDVLALSGDDPSLASFDHALRDRTTGTVAELDVRLLELLRQVARRHAGARIELVSGYRSPKLNEMLRKKGHRVASHSQHVLGHAVDFRVIGLTPGELRAELVALDWQGGIGRYDDPSDAFVHADVGPKRAWTGRAP